MKLFDWESTKKNFNELEKEIVSYVQFKILRSIWGQDRFIKKTM